MPSNELTFVLVHGGWHDGTCWAQTISHLQAAGHRAHAPTMAGHGAEGGQPVSLIDCTNSVVDYIREQQLEDFMLVGHSISGIVISKVAELIPTHVRRLIYQNAYVLRDGECVYDLLPLPIQQTLDERHAVSPTAEVALDFDTFHRLFISDGDLETAKAAFSQLTPGTINRQFERVNMKVFETLDIPTSYVHCLDDVTMAAAGWRWHPDMSGRLKDPRIIEMPGSHEVCFSNPKVLAEALIEAA